MQKTMTSKPAQGLNVESVLITPDIAAAWLDHNTNNRRVNRTAVGVYASDMKGGKWRLTGDPIRFDINNVLIDGQHRLMACVAAGVSFATTVIYGLPAETRDVLDIGRRRSVADILSLRGEFHEPTLLVAAARILIRFKNGLGLTDGIAKGTSPGEVLDMLDRHPKLQSSTVRVGTIPRGFPKSAIVATHYVGGVMLGKPDKADQMIEVIKTGVPSYPGDPIHLYRERLMVVDRDRMTGPMKVVNLVNAWNHFAAGRPIARMMTPKTKTAEFDGLDTDLL